MTLGLARPAARGRGGTRAWRRLVLVGLLVLTPALSLSVPVSAAAAAAEGEAHGESLGAFLSRLANFAILAGGLYYLLRSPVGNHLRHRHERIREDLVAAASLRDNASRQVAEIEAKLAALPGELDELARRGQEEIVAEEARIRELAAAERERLLDQMRREIDLQVRNARRDLLDHAAGLAVGVASERLRRDLTPEDHLRLIDRFASGIEARP